MSVKQSAGSSAIAPAKEQAEVVIPGELGGGVEDPEAPLAGSGFTPLYK